jgi:hypothetical protein
LRQQFEEIVDFEAIPATLSDHDKELKNKYYNDINAQMLLRAIVRLGSKNKTGVDWEWARDERNEIDFDDIIDDLEQEEELYPVPKNKVLRELLNEFVDHALLELRKKGKSWIVPKRAVAWLLNVDLIGKNEEEKVDSDLDEEDDDDEKEEEDDDKFGVASMNPTNGLVADEAKSAALLPTLVSILKGSRLDPICIDFEENSASSLSVSITRNSAPTPCISPERSASRVSVNENNDHDNKRRKLE